MINQDKEYKTGTVKFYIDEKLFGFLIDDETGEEIYIPVSGLIDEIRKSSKVQYRIENGPKGAEAIDVRILKKGRG